MATANPSGEFDDLVEAPLDLLLGETQHDAVDEDVFPAGDLGMKPGAKLDECGDAAGDADPTLGGSRDPGHALEQRALARSVAPDDAVGAALRHLKRHAAQRLERVFGLQVADEAAFEQCRLERGELPLAGVPAVHLRDVDDVDRRCRHGRVRPLPRTSRGAGRIRSSRRGTAAPTRHRWRAASASARTGPGRRALPDRRWPCGSSDSG